MGDPLNIATGKYNFVLYNSIRPDVNATKPSLFENIENAANNDKNMAPLSASGNGQNPAGGAGTSSQPTGLENVKAPAKRIDEGQGEALTPKDAFLARPLQATASDLLYIDRFFGQQTVNPNPVQNDQHEQTTNNMQDRVEQLGAENAAQHDNTNFSEATTLIKTFFSRFIGYAEVPNKISQRDVSLLKEHGAAILTNLRKTMLSDSKEAWIKAHPNEDITKQPIFDFQYDSCLDQIDHAVRQLQAMSDKNVTGKEMSQIFEDAFAAITTIPHTLIYLAPSQPAAANPGPDAKAGPAAERGISIGNIENHQGDNTYHYHYHYPSASPGNENVGGKLSSNDASNSASSTEQMKRDAPPAAEPGSSTTTINRAETKDKSTETDSPADGAKGHGKQLRDMFDSQLLTPKGNDEPDANQARRIADDEQFIDSSKLSPDPREIKKAELKINVEGFDELPKGNDKPDAHNNRLITDDEQFIDSSKLSYDARETKRAELKINVDGFDELPKGDNEPNANNNRLITGDEQFIDSSKLSYDAREIKRAELKINVDGFDALPKGDNEPNANNNRLIADDEQFIDSSKFSYGAREIKRALLKINADGFDELPKGYEPAFANKVVSVTMKNKANTLFSQPQNAIQSRYASNLRPSRPLGQEDVGNVAETPRGEIKGVKALRDFFENEAFKDRNGRVLDNGSAHNRSSGYESAAHSRSSGYESADDDSVADMSDVESYLSTDDDRYGDAVRRDNRPLMNSSSADDSGYDSDGSTNDSLSIKDLYHARRVQVDETDASRDETDGVTLGTDEISEVKKKIALFNKENVVATKPAPKEYQFKVKESDRVHLTEAKAITLSTSGMFKK
ncbi:hypothetical protein AAH678_19565 [Sodalis endosymbiont of Spalangia cameroni]|uniref:hypothetical protein n=1 Tax=Sodalis praecaptivus TaxID=1239307 RepID=UPI0031F8083D